MQAVGSLSLLRDQVEACQPEVSIRHQCELMRLSRSGYYYQPCPETEENLQLMRPLDRLHWEHPVYGSRRLVRLLNREGLKVNRMGPSPRSGS